LIIGFPVLWTGFFYSLYFYTAFALSASVFAGSIDALSRLSRERTSANCLSELSFQCKPGIVSGFPLPTPVLTPGWAIQQSDHKEK
jgi:hypothetical protein